MLVRIDSANSGWREYVLGQNQNRIGAELLHGDPFLGDEICQTTAYNSGQYIRFVLSFYDDLTADQAREISDDFFNLLMVGFCEDEYHRDSVLHTDSEHDHIHARIPKLNLFTGTQLKIYNHKTDLKRHEAIKAYIVKKHNLTATQKSLVKNPKKTEIAIQEMRAWAGKNPFTFTKKGDRDKEKMRLIDFGVELVMAEFANSEEDVKGEFRQMGLDIVNEGFDISKNEHYVTVQNDTGKLRLMGDIFGKEFFTNSLAKQKEAIKKNKSIVKEKSLDQLKKELDKFQEKRISFIEKQYEKPRDRAEKKEKELQAVAEQEAITNPIQRSEDYAEITIPKEIKSGEEDRRRTDNRQRSVASLIAVTEQATADTERRTKSYLNITDEDYQTIEETRNRNEFNRRAKGSFATIILGLAAVIEKAVTGAAEEVKEIFKEGKKPMIESVLDQEDFTGESETPRAKSI